MSHDATSTAKRKTRLQAWILSGLFLAPLLIAFALYYGGGWRPQGHTNHGELIQPLRVLPQVALLEPAVDGRPVGRTSPKLFRGKWSLIFIGGGDCNERCRTALTDMRQVRLALGKDMGRVQRVFLYTGHFCDTNHGCDPVYFSSEQSGVIAAAFDDPAATALRQAFPAVDGGAGAAGRIYIADPLGNLVLTYAAKAPRRGILDDLEQLLKLSQIG